MKKKQKFYKTPGDILDMLHQQPLKKCAEWKVRDVAKHHGCTKCGERRSLYIVRLRSGFAHCDTCGQDFIVDEYLEKENKHETKE